jgi:hypothetical protein
VKFIEYIKNIKPENLVPLDEGSINLAYTRLYGRAKKNERVKEGVKDTRFERQSILSTMPLNGEKRTLIFGGTLNKELFAEYLRNQLAPTFPPDNALLLDNSPVRIALRRGTGADKHVGTHENKRAIRYNHGLGRSGGCGRAFELLRVFGRASEV